MKICLAEKLENLVGNIKCEKFIYKKNGKGIESFPKGINFIKKYDVIIDLNPKPIFDISEKINKLNSVYKIGFKSNFSDAFYNIQFDMGDTKFLETSYGQIKNILQIP